MKAPFPGRSLAAALLAIALAMPAHAQSGAATPAPAPCGTIVLPTGIGASESGSVTGLNPIINLSGFNSEAANALYRPLIWTDAEHHIDPRLSLASKVEQSSDGLTFHVTLGHWMWSDGKPVTADDALYCFEIIKRLGKTYGEYGQADMPYLIDQFTVTGERTFDVHLVHPIGRQAFVLNGLSQIYPFPRHAWGKISTDEMWRRQTDPSFFSVVDGPYRAAKFAVGRYVVLQANPAYSGPKPTVRRIVLDFLEGTDALRALESGETDASNVPFAVWDAVQHLAGYHLVRPNPPYSFYYITLNFKNPAVSFFGDLRVRQAIADAIDDKQIIDLVFHGNAVETHTVIPAFPPSGLSDAARAGHWPVGYDPGRARALLDEAGWTPGPGGVRTKDGKRLAFTLLIATGSDTATLQAQIVDRNLRAVGVDMTVEALSFTQMLPLVDGPSNGWEAFNLSWIMSPWPEGFSLFGTNGVNNVGGYSDPRMDVMAQAMNLSDSLDAVHAYGDYAAEQEPVIVLPQPELVMLVRDGITGWKDMLNPIGIWAPEFLRLSGPMACHGEPHRAS